MPVSVEEFTALKKKADLLRQQADRAAGALEAALAKLKADYGCKDLEAAEKLLTELEQEEAVAEAEYKKVLAKFTEEWGDKLDEIDD